MTDTRALVAVSLVLLVVRLIASRLLGFGDAEALYACYALFPQVTYLDHPGLVGEVFSLLGGRGAPSPQVTHLFTAALSTAVPWLGVLAARLAGASRPALVGLLLVAAPEIGTGLHALTPDLLLAVAWLLGAALFFAAVRAETSSPRALFAFLGAGLCVGVGTTAKVSCALLGLGMVAALLARPCRRHLRSPGPWLALTLGLIPIAKLIWAEQAKGFAMLEHRFVATQQGAGLSLRNLGALVGGQLAYVSPLLAVGAALALHRVIVGRPRDEVSSAIRAITLASLVPLVTLCLWSRVAEPHWLAPALLLLPLAHVLSPQPMPKLITRHAVWLGLAMSALVHLWALTDLAPRLPRPLYEPRYDLTNDLYAWRDTLPVVERVLDEAESYLGERPLVLAPHWTIAAQLKAGLGDRAQVATTSKVPDDFTRWVGAAVRDEAEVVLWVTDDRFEARPPAPLDQATVEARVALERRRAGTVVRRVEITVLSLPSMLSR